MISPPVRAAARSEAIAIGIAFALIYGLLAIGSNLLTPDGSRIATIWLPNAAAVAAGLILRLPVTRVVVPAFIGNVAASLTMGLFASVISGALSGPMTGTDPQRIIGFSIANAAEIAILLALSGRIIARPERIKDVRCLFQFLGIAALGAGASGLIAAVATAATPAAIPVIWWHWWLAHAMAMMTFVPVLLVIDADRRDWHRRGIPLLPPRALLDILLGALVIAVIFAQSRYPFLFLATPVILAVAARRGSAASALLLIITTLIAARFTMAGYGPINLVAGEVHIKTAVLQFFIFATFVSTLPITFMNERIEALRERAIMLTETMNEIPFSLDLAGRWTFVSRHWSTIAGKRELPLGQRALTFVPPPERAAMLRAMASLRVGELAEAHFEFRAHFAQAEAPADPVYLKVRVRRLHARDGSVEGFGGIISDISSETQSQRALADSEHRLHSLAESAPVGIFQLDNEGNATFLNSEWARMHGISIEEGMGKGWQRLLDGTQLERYASFAPERQAGVPTDIETFVRHPDGTLSRLRIVNSSLRNSDGDVIGRMGVVLDQTREHEAQAALQAALEEARSAATAQDRFFALMSHELRTPMNGVLGFAERLRESPLSDDQRRYVSLISRSGEIMLALLNDILDTSRMREGKLRLANTPYNLSATMGSICQHFEALAAQQGLQLRCTFASPLPKLVTGDKQRLTQVLNNLLGNALKFTEQGWISLYARIEPQYDRTILIVEVTDTGIGIAPENAERIFDAFDQGAEDTAMRFGGTGLGLPIARGLAEQMGGSLGLVTSNPGKGSIFRFTLPLDISSQAAPPGARPAAEPAMRAPSQSARSLRVLVAEDNEINQQLMTDILAKSGCAVVIAGDGQQAVNAVSEAAADGKPFDLVLMDLRMPVLDGIAATVAIRAKGIGPDALPIIAVTASVHPDTMTGCWQAGMQDYASKPVSRASIEAIIEKWGRSDMPDESIPNEGALGNVQAVPAGLDPELAPLLGRFIEQCNDCLMAVTAALEIWPRNDPGQLGAVQTMAHSVAGLAATFAAPQLVAPAQALDLMLDTTETEAIEQTLKEMQAALRNYLAATPRVAAGSQS